MAKKKIPTVVVYNWIEMQCRQATRDLGRSVFPIDIEPRMPRYRAEGSLRRDMYQMYRQGRLVRVGGEGARQGYRLPTRMERLAWSINRGIWPVGCERVAVLSMGY